MCSPSPTVKHGLESRCIVAQGPQPPSLLVDRVFQSLCTLIILNILAVVVVEALSKHKPRQLGSSLSQKGLEQTGVTESATPSYYL